MTTEQGREVESETFRLCLLSAVQTGFVCVCVCSVKDVYEAVKLCTPWGGTVTLHGSKLGVFTLYICVCFVSCCPTNITRGHVDAWTRGVDLQRRDGEAERSF